MYRKSPLALSSTRKVVWGGGVPERFRFSRRIRWKNGGHVGTFHFHWAQWAESEGNAKKWGAEFRPEGRNYSGTTPRSYMGSLNFLEGQLWNVTDMLAHFLYPLHSSSFCKAALIMGSYVACFGYICYNFWAKLVVVAGSLSFSHSFICRQFHFHIPSVVCRQSSQG